MILAFDTSGKDLHIGLFDDDARSLGEFHHIALASERGVHDSLLAEKSSRLLETHSARVHDIRRIAYVSGPGSFTGLRIGLAFAKGLAFASDIALVPIVAHAVLRESAMRSFPDRSFIGIVTAGYEPSTVYHADFELPEDVVLRRVVDVRGPILGPTDLHRVFSSQGVEHTPVDLDLNMLAHLSRTAPAAAPLASLEPFYGTDFKPHPAASKG